MRWSEDFTVMFAPGAAYASATANPAPPRWLGLGRPALVALLLGTGSAFASTGHLTFGLLVSGFLCWSFVPLLQIATAAVIMRSPATRSLELPRRLDLWFMGHMPWSLWLFTASLLLGIAPTRARIEWLLIVTAAVPIVWTSVVTAAFCRVVLEDSRHMTLARTALHQVVTWTIATAYVGWAVALWPRLVAFVAG